jgi:hypothetical protein
VIKKHTLLASTTRYYRPSVILGRHGHPMRSDDRSGHDGGTPTPSPTPAPSGDNNGGNSGTNGGESGGGNNGGQSFDLSAFWASPDGGSSASPSGESAGSGQSSSGQQQPNGNQGQQQQQQPTNPVQQLQQDIQALTFNNPMTADVMTQLSEGNVEGFQTGMNQLGQQAVQHAIRLMLPILSEVRNNLRTEIQGSVTQNNQSRDDEAALLKAIPSAANPAVRPMVDSIFQQAMKHSSNDRTKALALTKDMLRLQMQTMGSDVGMPPPTAGDGFGSPSRNINWADELLGRN